MLYRLWFVHHDCKHFGLYRAVGCLVRLPCGQLGGFNYVSKEIEPNPDEPASYYSFADETACPNLRPFLDDIEHLLAHEGSWVIPILGSEGARSRPSQIHFCYNTQKHDASYNDPKSRIKDYATFDALYRDVEQQMSVKFGPHCDKNDWYRVLANNIAYHISADNVFTLRMVGHVLVFDNSVWAMAQQIAHALLRNIELGKEPPLPPEMMTRMAGRDFGMASYID